MKVDVSTVKPLPSTIIKMEDRKRPAGSSVDDLAPPTKRQAINGSTKASADADMPWKEDLERYQKDAIYRQMLEYKREKATLESQLKDVQKRAVDHDDHLRVIDAWWSQLLEEVTLLTKGVTPRPALSDSETPFPTALHFKSSEEFSDHLSKKAREIKSRVNEIIANLSPAKNTSTSPDLDGLRKSLTGLLASQKEQMVKFDRLRAERDDISEQLGTATLRYIKAEKRLDRSKSAAVAKMEQQAIAGTGNSAGSGIGGVENGFDTRGDVMNGVEEGSVSSEASQLALKEATAAAAKQKEQLDNLLLENKGLTEQLTTATTRLSNLTDEDYAKTELFKNFKAQHEDVIKRINHLEATNIQLREEAEKLQAERTAFQRQIENEAEVAIGDLESQLQRVESDLTRIRSARDELIADLSQRKASQEQERTAIDHMRELVDAKEERVFALETEIQRLKEEVDPSGHPTPRPDVTELNIDELQRKYIQLEESFAAVNVELPSMERAYKKAVAASQQKVLNFAAMEEKINMLNAEKSKADQKYFAARKDMDTRIAETRSLRAQNAKSSEIISQLKDVETSNRLLLTSLEKQLSDMRHANSSIMAENKKLEGTSAEATSKLDNLKAQIAELTALLKTKDSACSSAKQHALSIETDLEQLKTRYEAALKEKDTWKAKSLSKQSGEEEMLRTLALCTVCRSNFKNTALKTCGHLFCNSCVEDRIANRMRKCPNCSRAFDKMDVMAVHM